MRVKFWGTRGSIPTPGPDTVIYGGNTPCVEVRLSTGARLILDAGSGIRKLGMSLVGETKLEVALLLTHVHWDHIQGFPFFVPAYKDTTVLDIYGLEVAHRKIDRLLSDQMEQVYFPVDMSSLRAAKRFHDFNTESFDCRGARVSIIRANHTTETAAFRIEHEGRSCVFMPDNELARCGSPGTTPYKEFIEFVAGTDLLIHDSQYTDATYARFKGWGHSTFEEAVKLGIEGGVKRVALFHHDPNSTDAELDRRQAVAREHVRQTGARIHVECAREDTEHDLAAPELAAAAAAAAPAARS